MNKKNFIFNSDPTFFSNKMSEEEQQGGQEEFQDGLDGIL